MGSTYTNVWESKTWSGFPYPDDFNSRYIWTDGENIYYSEETIQYVLDKATSTWQPKTWSGLSQIYGGDVWTDGTDIYYDDYVLNKATSTWESKTWIGLPSAFNPGRVWTDGENIYYSNWNDHYVLDKATSTWSQKTWSGLARFSGGDVWTDGTDIYYSGGDNQYILDKATSTWSQKTWSGLARFSGTYIWTDGTDIYYSEGDAQYVLDKATSTWSQKTWVGLSGIDAEWIWTDGSDIYYEGDYALVKAATSNVLSKLTLPVDVEGTITNVEFTLKDAYARERLTELGSALYWMGVTTTVMSDGLTTANVIINGETVTPEAGGLVSYNGSEFVWNGNAWQELGKANFGALAFKSSAEGSYTPAGSVVINEAADTTTSLTPFGSAGTLPDAYFTVSGDTATFVFDAGTLPTAGSSVTAVTASGARTATFSGTADTITVE